MVVDATVVEKDAIDELMVEKLARSSQSTTMALTQTVFLQHKCLFDDFLEDWQSEVQVFLALKEVIYLWILCVHDTFALMFDIALGDPIDILDFLNEFITHQSDQLALLLQALIEYILLAI